jgi:hypothetical protein
MYEDVLISLSEREVKYLVVGAVALGLSGYPRATLDLDILPELSEENLEKLISALREMGYQPMLPIEWSDLKDPQKRAVWNHEKNMVAFSVIHLQKPRDVVDLVIVYPLDFDFEACYTRSQTVRIKHVEVHLACLEDLLELKRHTGREKDLADVRVIQRMIRSRNDD